MLGSTVIMYFYSHRLCKLFTRTVPLTVGDTACVQKQQISASCKVTCKELVSFLLNMWYSHVNEIWLEHRRHHSLEVVKARLRAVASYLNQPWKEKQRVNNDALCFLFNLAKGTTNRKATLLVQLHITIDNSYCKCEKQSTPLHHCKGISESCSKNVPNKMLSQASDSLEEGAEVPERAVKSTTVVFCSDIEPPTWKMTDHSNNSINGSSTISCDHS